MNKTLKSFLIVFPFYFGIILLVTWGMFSSYFQQDEWMGFASIIRSYNLPWWDIFVPGTMHFAPLGVLFWSVMYHLFKLQAQYYVLVGLLIHTSVTALVFVLTARLTKNKMIALIAGLLFLLNGRAHQGFTHLAIFHSTDTTMFFIVLFFVYLANIKDKFLSFKNTLILYLIFLAAIGFREEGFIVIPGFWAYLLAFDKAKLNKRNMLHFFLLGVGLVAFLAFRFFAQTLYADPIPVQYQASSDRAVYNLATIPIKMVVQNIIYYQEIAIFFLKHHEKIYPGMVKNIYLDNAPLMDVAYFYIFSLLSCIVAIWMWAIHPKKIGSFLVFFAVLIVSNAFILSFVGFPIFTLEPRYLYYSAFPVFCIIAIFMYTVFVSKSRYRSFDFLKRIFVVALFIVLLTTSYKQIRVAVDQQIRDGVVKKKILASLRQVHPTLSKNTIFYVQCRIKCYRNGELGLPLENVLPFPSGPGMVMLVMYSQGQEKEWGDFFVHYFLFHTFSEDYKKIGDRSFGYFTTKQKLEAALKKNKILKETVVALEYNEENYTLKDISKSFRKTLQVK